MGIFESLNIIIPRINGGSSTENLGLDSNFYKSLRNIGLSPSQSASFSSNVPTYWGEQPILEAPPWCRNNSSFSIVFYNLYSICSKKYIWIYLGIVLSILFVVGKT